MPKTDDSFDPDEYAPVAHRIALFYTRYPEGRIVTELLSPVQTDEVIVRASVYRTEGSTAPAATGLAAERRDDGEINAVACLENAETSAIGRALANLGFTAARQRPSSEEMERAAARARQRLAGSGERPRLLPSSLTAPVAAAPPSGAAPPTRAARGLTAHGHGALAHGALAHGALAHGAHERMSDVRARGSDTRARAPDEALQARANAAADALDLLAEAERAGMRAARAERIRSRILHDRTVSQADFERLQVELRRWLVRRETEALVAGGAVAAG